LTPDISCNYFSFHRHFKEQAIAASILVLAITSSLQQKEVIVVKRLGVKNLDLKLATCPQPLMTAYENVRLRE